MNYRVHIKVIIALFSIFVLKLKLLNGRFKSNKAVLVQKKRTGVSLAEQLYKSNCAISKWRSNAAQPNHYALKQTTLLLEVDKKDLLTPTQEFKD